MREKDDIALFAEFVESSFIDFADSLAKEKRKRDIDDILFLKESLKVMRPIEANKLLRDYIDDKEVEKFAARFRASKYRKKKNKKTVQLDASTHERLLKCKELLSADTVDEALYYLMSKRYEHDLDVMSVKEELGDTTSDLQHFNLKGFLDRLTLDDRYILFHLLTKTFMEAWNAHIDIDTTDVESMNAAMSKNQYLTALLEDEKLVNEVEYYQSITN